MRSFPENILEPYFENVSRETFSLLEIYGGLLEKWQTKINLISSSTIPDMWRRHFSDSWQLLSHLPVEKTTLLDLGSGAGFPGLVLALARPQTLDVTLLESDLRKCFFLENVSRETFVPVKVVCARIESLLEPKSRVITARALAALDPLLAYAFPLLEKGGFCLFLKGKGFEEEVEIARKRWDFCLEIFPSLTEGEGRILKISQLERCSLHD